MQSLPHGLGAGRQKETPAQYLTDPFDAKRGVLPLQLDDLVSDRRGQLRSAFASIRTLQARLAILPIGTQPQHQTGLADAEFLTDQRHGEPFLEMQPDGFELFGFGETAHFFRAASPLGGAVPLLLYYNVFIHVNTPFIIGVSTAFLLKSVS